MAGWKTENDVRKVLISLQGLADPKALCFNIADLGYKVQNN